MRINVGYVQAKDAGEGIFFRAVMMEPKVSGWAEAFRTCKTKGNFSPADELHRDMDGARPLMTAGRWVGTENAESDAKSIRAANGFLSCMSRKELSKLDATICWTGINRRRNSHLQDTSDWITSGFSPESSEKCPGSTGQSLDHPNMASDTGSPGAARHRSDVPDRETARNIGGEISAVAAALAVEAARNRPTNEFGSERQAVLYSLSYGVTN